MDGDVLEMDGAEEEERRNRKDVLSFSNAHCLLFLFSRVFCLAWVRDARLAPVQRTEWEWAAQLHFEVNSRRLLNAKGRAKATYTTAHFTKTDDADIGREEGDLASKMYPTSLLLPNAAEGQEVLGR